MARPVSETIRLNDVNRSKVRRRIVADEVWRARLARKLHLVSLQSLEADLIISAWKDGAEVTGRLDAVVTQLCGVTAEPLEQVIDGEIFVRFVPAGSPNAVAQDEPDPIDPEADDPPDVLDGEVIDLAALVEEHLALEIDPFPRKPGAVFEPPAAQDDASPFAVLRRLKPEPPEG